MTSRIAYNNPRPDGSLGLPYHYELLADRRRVAPLKRAVERVAGGRRVLESGAGSGLLSILAARAGARRVYAFERDPGVARFLRQNVERSGCSAVVRIVEKDTRSATLDDLEGLPVDVVIAEHLSTWQVAEPQVSVLNHVNRYLAHPWAVRIPERATNRLELACSRFRFGDAVELRTHYFGFSGVPRPRLLSAPTTCRAVDFGRPNGAAVDETVDVVATKDGVANSLRLTSPLQILGDISFNSSDSLMPPVVVPLDDDLEVRAGEVVRVQIRYRCETTWSAVRCTAWRTGVPLKADPTEHDFDVEGPAASRAVGESC